VAQLDSSEIDIREDVEGPCATDGNGEISPELMWEVQERLMAPNQDERETLQGDAEAAQQQEAESCGDGGSALKKRKTESASDWRNRSGKELPAQMTLHDNDEKLLESEGDTFSTG
ncbi:unnamed protein product, partial [Amoebophrya sp. A120]